MRRSVGSDRQRGVLRAGAGHGGRVGSLVVDLAVVATIAGQTLMQWQPVLLLYAGIVSAAFVAFVLGYELPALRRQFGSDYEAYQALATV
jgi:hypothetical protein